MEKITDKFDELKFDKRERKIITKILNGRQQRYYNGKHSRHIDNDDNLNESCFWCDSRNWYCCCGETIRAFILHLLKLKEPYPKNYYDKN